MDADLSYPIILAPDGTIADGRHRLIKALTEKKEFINAVQLESLPPETGEAD